MTQGIWFSLVAWLTGGRPMKRVAYRFTDFITGKPVYIMEDSFGRLWMAADGPWSLHRVPSVYRKEE